MRGEKDEGEQQALALPLGKGNEWLSCEFRDTQNANDFLARFDACAAPVQCSSQ
jgi:hypothetical protein